MFSYLSLKSPLFIKLNTAHRTASVIRRKAELLSKMQHSMCSIQHSCICDTCTLPTYLEFAFLLPPQHICCDAVCYSVGCVWCWFLRCCSCLTCPTYAYYVSLVSCLMPWRLKIFVWRNFSVFLNLSSSDDTLYLALLAEACLLMLPLEISYFHLLHFVYQRSCVHECVCVRY